MRIRLTALVIPFLIAACGGSSKATTGKEFLEKFQTAVKDKEAGTIWQMLSRNTQLMLEATMKKKVVEAYYSETTKSEFNRNFEAVKWTGDGDKDLRQVKPKLLCLDQLQRDLDDGSGYREFRDYRFVEEKPMGKGVILTVKDPGETKTGIVLARKDDYLKFDQELTTRYATEKR